METTSTACSTLLGLIRKDTAYADVDLVFEGGAVLTAHAVVLASMSDYYKEALSEKWTANAFDSLEVIDVEADSKLSHISNERPPRSNSRKITLNHPNINAETAKIVLDYLYLADADIPLSLASSVIVFADEIMVFSLVQKCADILVKEENLSMENALKETSVCQDAQGDLALESNLPEDFQIEVARKMIKPLLPVVDLFKISAAHSSLMEPFQVLLSEYMQRMLVFHLKGTTRGGGSRWKAGHVRLMDSVHAIEQHLPVPLNSFVASDPTLLFHGEPGTCTDDSLRKARDGIPNTLTLVKLKTGSIFGGFSPDAWMSQYPSRVCPDSFVFLAAPNGAYLRLPFRNDNGILGGTCSEPRSPYEPNYEMYVNDHVLTVRMSRNSYSRFGEREGCEFIKQLSAAGCAQGAIEYYEVYHTR
ncbi:hypothetical protein HDU78_003024 [Chytriomyces hyalinus]|nr:hypothetical protein HDU78_003024 [Chytriomyces hyalinus]